MRKHRKLNTGGFAALLITLVALDAMTRYPEANDAFRLFCLLFMSAMGGLTWVSFRKFGVFLDHRYWLVNRVQHRLKRG